MISGGKYKFQANFDRPERYCSRKIYEFGLERDAPVLCEMSNGLEFLSYPKLGRSTQLDVETGTNHNECNLCDRTFSQRNKGDFGKM